MTDEIVKHSIRDQAEEVSLRVAQGEDLIAKRRGKIATEMLAIMEHRIGILRAAEKTMWWLAANEDVVRAKVGSPSPGRTRYWIHPESGSFFTTENGEHGGGDGLVEELDEDTWKRQKAEYEAEIKASEQASAPPATDPPVQRTIIIDGVEYDEMGDPIAKGEST